MTFNEQVYHLVRQIPRGRVATYGQLALLLGRPRASRVVGHALHLNPDSDATPCHRVVNRLGAMAPTFAFGGGEIQRMLLEAEGVGFTPQGCVDLVQYGWRPE